MALVSTIKGSEVLGERKLVWGTLAWDSSYPTGGEAITLVALSGLEQIDSLIAAGYGYTARWDATNAKVILSANGAEVANATDVSAVSAMPFHVIGQ